MHITINGQQFPLALAFADSGAVTSTSRYTATIGNAFVQVLWTTESLKYDVHQTVELFAANVDEHDLIISGTGRFATLRGDFPDVDAAMLSLLDQLPTPARVLSDRVVAALAEASDPANWLPWPPVQEQFDQWGQCLGRDPKCGCPDCDSGPALPTFQEYLDEFEELPL